MEQTQIERDRERETEKDRERQRKGDREGLVWFVWFPNLVINNWAISWTGPKTDI